MSTMVTTHHHGDLNMPKNRTVEVYIHTHLCKGVDGCGLCVKCCPTSVFERGELNERGIRPPVVARPGDCTGCEQCMLFCPDLAVVVTVKE